jgi:hypothetical protein
MKLYEKYMKEGKLLDEGLNPKQIQKLAKAELIAIRNQLKSLEQDINNGDIHGIQVSSGTIKFSAERMYKAAEGSSQSK